MFCRWSQIIKEIFKDISLHREKNSPKIKQCTYFLSNTIIIHLSRKVFEVEKYSTIEEK